MRVLVRATTRCSGVTKSSPIGPRGSCLQIRVFPRGLLVEEEAAPSLGLSTVAGVARLDRIGHANDTTDPNDVLEEIYERRGGQRPGQDVQEPGPGQVGLLDTEGPSR